ncbi:protein kinase [bacterium]|nr:protein kinase [bacterium]
MSQEVWIQGRYRLDKVLGEGGMATVYRAWQVGLERWVAIKHCRPQSADELEQFREEARLLGSLHHPAMVTVHELIESADEAHLVMELVEGSTLRQCVERELPLEQQCLDWMEEILDVLEFLHGQNPPVILKDLKPDNVMVEPSGRLRVLDFGIAKRLVAGGGTQLLLKGVGSEHYAPLEQYGQGSTDQRSDFYALGATLYFMLTGTDPMPAWQRLAKHQDLDPLQQRGNVSETTCELIRQLTSLFPQDRPGNEALIRHALRQPAPTPTRRKKAAVEVTRVAAPPPGRSRLLQAELRQRWDLSGLCQGHSLLAWSQADLLLAGPTLRRLQIEPAKVMQDWGQQLQPAALAVSNDGRRVALASKDRGLLCWQASGGSPGSAILEGGPCQWLRFAGNQCLLTLCQGQLSAYSFPEARKLRNFGPQQWWLRFTGHRLRACQADRRRVAAAASDGALFVWEHGTGELLWQSHQPSPTLCLDFSPDSQFLLSAAQDASLSVWQAETGQCLLQTRLERPWQALHCLDRAILGVEAEAIVVWDFSNACPRLQLQMPEGVLATALSPAGKLACLLGNGRLLVLDFALS